MIKIEETTGHYLSDVLTSIVKAYRVETYLEIGVNDGRSLAHVVKANPHLKHVYLADNWGGQSGGKSWGSNNHIKKLLDKLNYKGEVTYLDGNSQDTIPDYVMGDVSFMVDLVNVDGDHRKGPAQQDLRNVFPLAKMVVFDDINHIAHKYLNTVWDEEVAKQDIQWSQKYKKGHGVAFAMLGLLDQVI